MLLTSQTINQIEPESKFIMESPFGQGFSHVLRTNDLSTHEETNPALIVENATFTKFSLKKE